MAETNAQLQLLQKGGPFKLVQAPMPTTGPGDVLIRQRVIAFNPLDVKMRDYGFGVQQWPGVLGTEGAGVVEAVGSDVRHLQPGDEVGAWEFGPDSEGAAGGGFQEVLAIPGHFVVKKPKNISLEEAASLP